MPLACFCDCTGRFMLDLVRNPEDWFSCIAAQIVLHRSNNPVNDFSPLFQVSETVLEPLGMDTKMDDAWMGNESERPGDALTKNDNNYQKLGAVNFNKTVKMEPVEISETEQFEGNDQKHKTEELKPGLGDTCIGSGKDAEIALKNMKYLGNDFHPLISSFKGINEADYVRDIKREVPDDCEQIACESLRETIDQNFEEIDKLICENLNRENKFNKDLEREDVEMSKLEDRSVDTPESVNSVDKTESVLVIKTIKEDDTVLNEIVIENDIAEEMIEHNVHDPIGKTENELGNQSSNLDYNTQDLDWQTKGRWKETEDLKPFQCTICKLSFLAKKYLRRHILDCHGDQKRKFPCDICFKAFKHSAHLKAHKESVHLDSRSHVCTLCGQSYKGRGSLSLHMRTHTGEHETCPTCGRDFRDAGDLKKHIKVVHLKIKNFKCDICGHAFANQSNLSVHAETHIDKSMDDRKFKCKECDWRAGTSTALKVHMKTHIKTLDYKCPHCEKEFKCEDYMEKHIHHVHKGSGETFPCTECPKSFARKGYLTKHMKVHGIGRRYKCQICDAIYTCHGHLKRHIEHSHEGKKLERKTCKVCGRSVVYLKQHMQSHIKEKPFKCEKCDRKFRTEKKLKLHYRVHLDVKPYFCKGCDSGFSQQKYYILHMVKYHDVKLSPKEAELRGRIEHMEFSDSD